MNLLISVQNELISRANSLSKTWVKYFYVFVLAHHSCSTAQWTKSLSDTNNPPTLSSAASLEICQVHWVYVLWGDPSCVWLACWLGTERWSLWSPLLTMTLLLTVSPVTHSEATGWHGGPDTVLLCHLCFFSRKSDRLELVMILAHFGKLQTFVAFYYISFCKCEWTPASCQWMYRVRMG